MKGQGPSVTSIKILLPKLIIIIIIIIIILIDVAISVDSNVIKKGAEKF